jgi:hypothetical protein
MIQTVNFKTFHDAFTAIRPDNFTYSGLQALFDYLERYEEETGESIELDVIAICCDFSHYECTFDALEAYGLEDIEELENSTTVIECGDGTLIIQNF